MVLESICLKEHRQCTLLCISSLRRAVLDRSRRPFPCSLRGIIKYGWAGEFHRGSEARLGESMGRWMNG